MPLYDRGAPGYTDAAVCLSGIVAVEEETKLFIYSGRGGVRVATIEMNVGDIVVFRGDCWHAGAPNTARRIVVCTFMCITLAILGSVVKPTFESVMSQVCLRRNLHRVTSFSLSPQVPALPLVSTHKAL